MSDTIQIIVGGSAVLVFFLILSLALKEKSEGMRQFLFYSITAVVMFVTLFLVFDTVVKNQRSVTGGPVHWHADYLISSCKTDGQVRGERTIAHAGEDEHEEINLVDPTGLANRVGNPLLHEHGDSRIHVEGAVDDLQNINLAKFFAEIGGALSKTEMAVPTNDGLLRLQNGDLCADGEPGILQVFVYRTEGKFVIQEKLKDFPDYVPSPEAVVPPGDCIIIEFSSEDKDKTDKICDFYAIDIDQGKLELIDK